ncbi:Flp pilus assembly protein CpaB [Phenylobacterium sp.]|uniref:Flp pilus assembly protein CpaB n=1 Tax=Phenylobacterium sp. TaxID=1871053 RepID=UPI0035B3CEFF
MPLRLRRWLVLGLALAISALSIVLAQAWLQNQLGQARATGPAPAAPARQVLVAREPLAAGALLKPEDLRWQAWPANMPADGYLTAADGALDSYAGAVVRSDLNAGEPLTPARLARPGDRGFLAAVLEPGRRAITINVSASTGMAGFVFPGDRVDLILSRNIAGPGEPPRFVSETVLGDVRVVGMDQRTANPKAEVVAPQTATLEVTPRQAEVVALAGELGRLSLALRSLGKADGAPEPLHVVTRTSDVAGLSHAALDRPRAGPAPVRRAASPPPPPPPPPLVVVRGAQAEIVGGVS